MKKETRDVIVSRFFGVFFLFFQVSQVFGNLLSSVVFSYNADGSNDTSTETTQTDFECGSIMSLTCPSGSGKDLLQPDRSRQLTP